MGVREEEASKRGEYPLLSVLLQENVLKTISLPLNQIRKERIRKDTKKKVSHVIVIVMKLLWILVVV